MRIPLLSSGGEAAQRSGDEDVDYRARLLGHARVEVVTLMQTAASLSADGYDDRITRRMRDASGVPAITSAGSIGLAVRALGARRIALVAPFLMATIDRLGRYFAIEHSLENVVSVTFAGTDSIEYPALGQSLAHDAITRTDRPEVEIFVVPGGNFPTLTFIPEWERAVGKPVITTNQAAPWTMMQIMRAGEKLPAFGRLLEEMPRL